MDSIKVIVNYKSKNEIVIENEEGDLVDVDKQKSKVCKVKIRHILVY